MAFHVRDPKTDALVRELARKRGIGITEAIREMAEKELAAERAREADRADGARARAEELHARLRPLLDEIDAMPRSGFVPDKRFYDELWGQEHED
jgi:antitoxin VapB